MRAYKYTGEDPGGEIFPTLVFETTDEAGVVTHRTAHLLPGDTFTADGAIDHPRLESGGRATKDMPHVLVNVEEFPDEPAGEAPPDEPAAPPAAENEE